MIGKRIYIILALALALGASANDTVYVSGALEHEGLLDWTPVRYHSNTYLDLSLNYQCDSNRHHYHGLRATTRLEMTQWPMLGYEPDFPGHGMSHLSLTNIFDWGEISVGDVYGQFGSGLILNLYEDRSLGIDGALRGAKIEATPTDGLHLTALGGKQRRYWSCYDDGAWGWNYRRDALVGGDVELHIERWSKRMREQDIHLMIGASYVSKYEAEDSLYTYQDGMMYRYRLPHWVGAGDVRVKWQMRGVDVLIEYARKANDPSADNGMTYRDGEALMASLSYSRQGMAVLAQVKRSDNMSFRSERLRMGIAGRLNNLPAFAQHHTYALAAEHPYATSYTTGEWAFQASILYTWNRKTKMGGRYGTTLKLNASHIRGLAVPGSWGIDTSEDGEYYTDVNIELNKRLSKRWWLNAMLMYQAQNQRVIEGEGDLIRSGIAVVDTRVQVSKNVGMRGEAQYLYTPHADGQWVFLLYELSLFKQLTLSAEWMYNIGYAPEATNEHFYTFSATYSHKAHRLAIGYTKTQEGYHCAGGVCRYVPEQQGVSVNYSFNW